MVRAVNVLVVEDNEGDQRLIGEAFKALNNKTTPHFVSNGAAALDFLYRRGQHDGSPRPGLIILDLNLPHLNGCEVLRCIKGDPLLQQIPVVMFTTSHAEQDITNAYALHVNCYISKPTELDQFFSVIQTIDEFWCQMAQLPGATPSSA